MNTYFDGCTGILKINDSVSIMCYGKLPNKFHRLMVRILLGWKYEEAQKRGRKA